MAESLPITSFKNKRQNNRLLAKSPIAVLMDSGH